MTADPDGSGHAAARSNVFPAGNWCAVVVLIAAHASLLVWHALETSPVESEIGHLPAGISHWQGLGFAVYRQNPPLPRMIAALPVLLADPDTDWTHLPLHPNDRTETSVGRDFVRANPNRFLSYYRMGRLACIPINLIGLFVVIRWATELYGRKGGAISGTLYAFCPSLVGHGALIMPDVPAASLGVTAAYLFWRFLRQPSITRSLFAGLALGLAVLTKTTLVVLVPLWISMTLAVRFHSDRRRLVPPQRRLRHLAVVMLTGWYILNLGYLFEGSFSQLGELPARSQFFRRLTEGTGFATRYLSEVPVPFPRDFVLGVDTQMADFEGRAVRSYMRGRWRDGGWAHFYLYVLSVKMPIGAICLFAIALTASVWDWQTVRCFDQMFLLAHALAILALVSSQTGFTVHGRYIWPVLPYCYVLCGRVGTGQWLSGRFASRAILGLTLASAVSMLAQCPHSLGYCNEIAGGPRRRSFHLLDSNIGWGQDLLHLRRWCELHPEARPLYVLTPFGVDPVLAGVPSTPCPPPGSCSPVAVGWYVIDVNYLRGSLLSLRQECRQGNRRDRQLKEFTRTMLYVDENDLIGSSLYVYHVEHDCDQAQ